MAAAKAATDNSAETSSPSSKKSPRTQLLTKILKKHFPTNELSLDLEPITTAAYKGPICDPIGFTQHSGECWNDTIQQLMLFSDDLKEYTQPYFYNTPFSEIEGRIDAIVKPDLQPIIKKYVNAMQQRFINHYNLITTGDSRFETCTPAPILRTIIKEDPKHKSYRRRSLIGALNSARSIVGYEKESSGAKYEQYEKIYNILLDLAGANFSIQLQQADLVTREQIFGFHVRSLLIYCDGFDSEVSLGRAGKIYKLKTHMNEESTHAIGIVKCGGKHFLFDDNTGIFDLNIPFNEIQFVSFILVTQVDAKTFGTFAISCIYQMPSEIKAKTPMILSVKKPRLWLAGAWRDMPDVFFKALPPSRIYLFEQRMVEKSQLKTYALIKHKSKTRKSNSPASRSGVGAGAGAGAGASASAATATATANNHSKAVTGGNRRRTRKALRSAA